jgi:hypothetical protein
MAISTVAITQGSGTNITVDTSSGGDMQVIKIAESVLGSNNLVPASASTGLLVNIGTCTATSIPITNVTAQNLNVAVVGTATVAGAVTISNAPSVNQAGTWNIGTVATITNAVTVTGTVAISGTPSVVQSGTWNVGTVATITNPVTVAGSVSITGTSTITGTVTDNQGTPAATSNAWPIKVTDGTNVLAMQNVSSVYALPVKVLAQVGGGFSQADGSAFAAGTTPTDVFGGVYNDSIASPGSGQTAAARITGFRALHINLRRNDGTELGTSTNPLQIASAAGSIPVYFTSVLNQGNGNDGLANGPYPWLTWNSPSMTTQNIGYNPGAASAWKSGISISAITTGNAIHTPASGKGYCIEGLVICIQGSGTYTVTIYDNTNAAANVVFQALGQGTYVVTPSRPIPSSGINNVLKADITGTGTVTCLITAWGYDG